MNKNLDFSTEKSKRWLAKVVPMLFVFIIQMPALSTELVPEITISGITSGLVEVNFGNTSTGGTYYVEWTDNLASNEWLEIYSFEGDSGITNWSHEISGSSTSAFYRVVRDPYHAKVGLSASLNVPGFHNVSGTAHIVNNRTIELRNFNFDGGGIVVEVYVSPSPTFSPYLSLSDDLVGTVFINETVVLDVPEDANLDDFNYISIWCVTAGASFGDGLFQ